MAMEVARQYRAATGRGRPTIMELLAFIDQDPNRRSNMTTPLARIEKALEALRQEGLIEWDCDLVNGAVQYEVRPTARATHEEG
jgi:hypothetical protein